MSKLHKHLSLKFIPLLLVTYFIGMPSASAALLSFLPVGFDQQLRCTQGPGGGTSHFGSLANAFDFVYANEKNSLGKPLLSPFAGRVIKVTDGFPDTGNPAHNGGAGNTVTIQDVNTGKLARFMHCQRFSIGVKANQVVSGGDRLCNVGNSGKSTAAHIHMQFMNSSSGATIPFVFVETNPTCNGTQDALRYSKNLKNASVLDEDGSVNFGNLFEKTMVIPGGGDWKSHSAQNKPAGTGYNGLAYRWTTVTAPDKQSYTWQIRVKQTGFYKVVVNLPGLNPGRDTKAKYEFAGMVKFVDQRVADKVGKDNWIPLFEEVKLNAGEEYSLVLKGTTPGKTIGADSMILLKN